MYVYIYIHTQSHICTKMPIFSSLHVASYSETSSTLGPRASMADEGLELGLSVRVFRVFPPGPRVLNPESPYRPEA